ncbi:MAG: TspO/MBR family protein [Patescibacteria group bacterium]
MPKEELDDHTPTYNWYAQLKKPSWAPPAWLFGPVWTVLYIGIAISFGKVFWMAWQNEVPLTLAVPFALNLIFNFVFTPIQFRLKNNLLASLDILLVLATLIWGMFAVYVVSLTLHISTGSPIFVWIALVNIPYLLWVIFATVLQLAITYLNR